jgi:EAL domain-containing protein (putative c-di-GMP-specific phosphodiesterase class I)
MDDFGTGYSSLAYIKQFPIDTLKIDRCFVAELAQNASDIAIVQAIIILARTLSLAVVAEGIETVEQYELLRNLGCTYGQGFYFAPPLPASAMQKLLEPTQLRMLNVSSATRCS